MLPGEIAFYEFLARDKQEAPKGKWAFIILLLMVAYHNSR